MWEGLIEATVRLTVPLLLVSMGELISEKAGVINIGLEGMMSAGAFTGYIVMVTTGNPYLAAVAAMVAGVAVSLIVVAFSVYGGADQILVGFAIYVLVPGLTAFLYAQGFGENGITPLLPMIDFPILNDLPFVGALMFRGNAFYWAAIAIFVLQWMVLQKSRFGLLVTSAGHNPSVAASLGVPIRPVRAASVMICGALAALGGAALTVGALGSFSSVATGGRGFIAIGIVILGRWRSGGIALAALLIGFADAVRLRLGSQLDVPVQIMAMLPWLVMLAMLILGARLTTSPAALGRRY
jgi:general nucleoside transport system permease protein